MEDSNSFFWFRTSSIFRYRYESFLPGYPEEPSVSPLENLKEGRGGGNSTCDDKHSINDIVTEFTVDPTYV